MKLGMSPTWCNYLLDHSSSRHDPLWHDTSEFAMWAILARVVPRCPARRVMALTVIWLFQNLLIINAWMRSLKDQLSNLDLAKRQNHMSIGPIGLSKTVVYVCSSILMNQECLICTLLCLQYTAIIYETELLWVCCRYIKNKLFKYCWFLLK